MTRIRFVPLAFLTATIALSATAAQSQSCVQHGRMRLLCGE